MTLSVSDADPPESITPTPAATGAGADHDAGATETRDFTGSAGERKGSWGWDDPDRPRWDARTVPVAEYDYHDIDGTYLFTVHKGRHA